MACDSKNIIFERKIKIFYAALFFKSIFTFEAHRVALEKKVLIYTKITRTFFSDCEYKKNNFLTHEMKKPMSENDNLKSLCT